VLKSLFISPTRIARTRHAHHYHQPAKRATNTATAYCSHALCVILPHQRRASSVRISLVVNEEEEEQTVVVVIDEAQKRSIAPSLRKEKCIIFSQGTR